MSEDETFRKLKQTPYPMLKPLFNKYRRQRRGIEKESNFLWKHGWRYAEYKLHERG